MPPSAAQRGAYLLEALIGILIFSFGILGIVGLQAQAIRFTNDSEYRAEAVYLANSLISQMWTENPAQLQTKYQQPERRRSTLNFRDNKVQPAFKGAMTTDPIVNGRRCRAACGAVARPAASCRSRSSGSCRATPSQHNYTTTGVIGPELTDASHEQPTPSQATRLQPDRNHGRRRHRHDRRARHLPGVCGGRGHQAQYDQRRRCAAERPAVLVHPRHRARERKQRRRVFRRRNSAPAPPRPDPATTFPPDPGVDHRRGRSPTRPIPSSSTTACRNASSRPAPFTRRGRRRRASYSVQSPLGFEVGDIVLAISMSGDCAPSRVTGVGGSRRQRRGDDFAHRRRRRLRQRCAR